MYMYTTDLTVPGIYGENSSFYCSDFVCSSNIMWTPEHIFASFFQVWIKTGSIPREEMQ